MHSTYSFCPKCSGKLAVKFLEGRERQVCQACGFIFYRNPVPAAGVVLQENNSILLVKRKFEPAVGDWCLPSGFIEWDESPEQCAIRETKEETNLDVELTDLFGLYTGGEYQAYKVLLIFYRSVRTGGELAPGDDAMAAQFFELDRLPENIAFRSHREILRTIQHESH